MRSVPATLGLQLPDSSIVGSLLFKKAQVMQKVVTASSTQLYRISWPHSYGGPLQPRHRHAPATHSGCHPSRMDASVHLKGPGRCIT